jgi:hypothetical protein
VRPSTRHRAARKKPLSGAASITLRIDAGASTTPRSTVRLYALIQYARRASRAGYAVGVAVGPCVASHPCSATSSPRRARRTA